MKRLLIALALSIPLASQADKHIVVLKPLMQQDAKGQERQLGTAFTPSPKAKASAEKRAAAIKAGTKAEGAQSIVADAAEIKATPQPPVEYHIIVPDDFDHEAAGAVYAARWDGQAPYIEVLVGDHHTLTHAFMGWPVLTKDELPAPTSPIGSVQ